jgi:hypothetical protein
VYNLDAQQMPLGLGRSPGISEAAAVGLAGAMGQVEHPYMSRRPFAPAPASASILGWGILLRIEPSPKSANDRQFRGQCGGARDEALKPITIN